jgi:hypothetical protein
MSFYCLKLGKTLLLLIKLEKKEVIWKNCHKNPQKTLESRVVVFDILTDLKAR